MLRFAVCAAGWERAPRVAASLASHTVKTIEVGPRFLLENDEGRVASAAAFFHAQGIDVRSVHAPFRGPHDLSADDPAQRSAFVEGLRTFLRRAAAAKARVVVLHPGQRCTPEQVPTRLARCAESLRALAPLASELGITLAVENLPPGLPGARGEDLAALVAQVDHPAVRLCLDVGHAHMAGDALGVFEAMKPHIVHFHVHDNDGRRDLHLQPPYGTIDWEGFLRIFRTMGFTEPLTLECSPWGDELPPEGRGADSDYTRLLEETGRLFSHFEARLAVEEEQRRSDPKWNFRGIAPHRADMRV